MVRRLALLLVLTAAAVHAQDAPLTVSVDCPGYVPGCDVDFFQTEVPFARFVRDPAGADVAVLIAQQETGGGGRRYELRFRGRRAAAGRADTLAVQTAPGATDDTVRRALLGRLALGVAGYAARTGLADRLTVAYAAPAVDAPVAVLARDPWNNWVFRFDGNGYFNGQQQTSSADLFGSVSAARVTERWKLRVQPNGSYSRSTFDIDDSTTVVSQQSGIGVYAQAVRALSAHWSAAVQASVRRSTFQNYAARLTGGPAVEFNVFPYTEATRRQLRLAAAFDGEAVAYVDTTIFGRTRELTLRPRLSAEAVFAQPWGSANVSVDASTIATRAGKYQLGLNGSLDIRVVQGPQRQRLRQRLAHPRPDQPAIGRRDGRGDPDAAARARDGLPVLHGRRPVVHVRLHLQPGRQCPLRQLSAQKLFGELSLHRHPERSERLREHRRRISTPRVSLSPPVEADQTAAPRSLDRLGMTLCQGLAIPQTVSQTGRSTRHGVPTATTPAGIGFVTTLPAPITLSSPTVTPARRIAPPPIHTFSPTVIGAPSSRPCRRPAGLVGCVAA